MFGTATSDSKENHSMSLLDLEIIKKYLLGINEIDWDTSWYCPKGFILLAHTPFRDDMPYWRKEKRIIFNPDDRENVIALLEKYGFKLKEKHE